MHLSNAISKLSDSCKQDYTGGEPWKKERIPTLCHETIFVLPVTQIRTRNEICKAGSTTKKGTREQKKEQSIISQLWTPVWAGLQSKLLRPTPTFARI